MVGKNSKVWLEGDRDAEAAAMRTKEHNEFVSDGERRERDRDEQHIQSTYGSDMEGEKKAYGGQGNRGVDQKRGKSSFWSLEALFCVSHSPDGTPFARQILVELFRGDGFFRLCRQDAGRGYTDTHSRCNFEWTNYIGTKYIGTNYIDGKSDCFV